MFHKLLIMFKLRRVVRYCNFYIFSFAVFMVMSQLYQTKTWFFFSSPSNSIVDFCLIFFFFKEWPNKNLYDMQLFISIMQRQLHLTSSFLFLWWFLSVYFLIMTQNPALMISFEDNHPPFSKMLASRRYLQF